MWRQMTVEHIVGKSQGGYLKQIRTAVEPRFPELTPAAREALSQRIDALNTITACSFCNATTSRDVSGKTMAELLHEVQGSADDVMAYLANELRLVLERKRKDVQWKLVSVKSAFQAEVRARIVNAGEHNPINGA